MVKEFEQALESKEAVKHHEQSPGVQVAFAKEVKDLVKAMGEIGNHITKIVEISSPWTAGKS